MSIYTEIFDFFKEEDSREKKDTVPPEPEDRRGKKDTRRVAPEPKTYAKVPEEFNTKSYFLEGYVHRIVFKNIVSGQNRSYYTIYRKITKDEYDKLKNNNNIQAIIKPVAEKEHDVDVYYTPITSYNRTPKGTVEPKAFEAKKFIYLTKDALDIYKKDYPEGDPLEIVPIKDIYEKGIGVRNIELRDYLNLVTKKSKASAEKEKEKEKITKTISTKEKQKERDQNVDNFFSGKNSSVIDKIIKKIVFNYNDKTTATTNQEKEEISKKYDKSVEDLNNQILSYTEDEYVRNRIVILLKDKWKNNPEIYNDFVEKYKQKNKNTTIDQEDVPDKKEPKKDNKVEPVKKSKESDPSTDDVIRAKTFFQDKANTAELINAIKNYSSYLDSENDKLDQSYFEGEYRKNVIAYIKKLFSYSKSDKVRKYVISRFVKEKIQSLTDDVKLYDTFITTYKKYMNYLSSKKTNITEDKKSAPLYAVKVVQKSATDKLFTDKGVRKMLGTTDTYLRNLTQDEKKKMLNFRNEKGKSDIISIEPVDAKTKGYTSPSTYIRQKDKSNDVTFDPSNPEDIKKLVGKVKPGEKQYSVTLKYETGKGKDVLMSTSSIKLLVPDFNFNTKNPQSFETKKYRTRSKDTGKDIFDTVKGTISLNYLDPIGKTKEFKPVKFFVVDMQDKKIVKGFGTEEDAKKYAKELGGYPNTVLDKTSLDKYDIDISDTKPVDKKTDDTPKYVSKTVDKYEPEKKPSVRGSIPQSIEKDPFDIKDLNKLDKLKFSTSNVRTSELPFPFYVVDIKNKEVVKGFTGWGKAKEYAAKKGSDYKAYAKAAIPGLNLIKEQLNKEDKETLEKMRVSFTIQDNVDVDKQLNIKDNVKEVKEEKDKIVLVLAEAGEVTFDKEGTGRFLYAKDNEFYQTLNVPSQLTDIIKRAFAPAKEPEPKLEAYIRKRIRQAIKEAEVSQYWGYQGKDVKKKRLEEYLKKYDWGFQESENPYTHSNGSAKHAIVSKLMHELEAMGVDSIAMYNSYAPDQWQISDLSQLDDMSDSPLGSQLTQPYNPDSLTARGGRVAEEDGKVTSIAQQYLDKVNAKYKTIEDLAKGYNAKDRDIMGSESVKKVIQKAISQSYGKDATKAGPELKKAFMSISDEDLKNNP